MEIIISILLVLNLSFVPHITTMNGANGAQNNEEPYAAPNVNPGVRALGPPGDITAAHFVRQVERMHNIIGHTQRRWTALQITSTIRRLRDIITFLQTNALQPPQANGA